MPLPCPEIILRSDNSGKGPDSPPLTVKHELEQLGIIRSSAVWQPLRGGRTNRLWHVTADETPLVVKLYNPDAATPLFANDPVAEATVLKALLGTQLSPEAIFSGTTLAGPVLVYRHFCGTPWRSDPTSAATVLKSLHTTPIPQQAEQLPHAPNGSLALKQQTLAILDQIPSAKAAHLRALEPESVAAENAQLRLLHGDPVPDNILCTQAGSGTDAILIDWQCPTLGDPLLDLSLFMSPAMQIIARGRPLTVKEQKGFTEAYDDPPTTQRLLAMQPVLHWRMAAYCLWKTTRATPDFVYVQAMKAEISALKKYVTI